MKYVSSMPGMFENYLPIIVLKRLLSKIGSLHLQETSTGIPLNLNVTKPAGCRNSWKSLMSFIQQRLASNIPQLQMLTYIFVNRPPLIKAKSMI